MTKPDKDPLSRAQELENIVDRLEEKVAGDREAEDVPGKPSDREHAAVRGSTTSRRTSESSARQIYGVSLQRRQRFRCRPLVGSVSRRGDPATGRMPTTSTTVANGTVNLSDTFGGSPTRNVT